MFELEYVSRFFKNYGNEVGKYGVTKSVYADYDSTFRRQGMDQVLAPVWTYAEKAVEQAEEVANQK